MPELVSAAARVHLRWALTDGIGPLTFARLLVHLGDAERALGASAAELRDIPRIGDQTAESIARSRDAAPVDDEIAAAEEHGVRIICRADADWPEGLKRIPDPPLVLYVLGELRPTDAVALAIVGSRRCTIYGSEQARRFGELLAGAGFTVVSGLARGIDAFAHHGAVDAGGRSLAVMGRGLTEVYPPENVALAQKVLEHGAWLSELPMRAAVRAENFPGRNRIIAGLTLGTLVVEAAQRSGALITARLASEYNREVFAVPGRVQDPMSFGTNGLIRDGAAKLVMCLEDVLSELGEVGAALQRGVGHHRSAEQSPRAERSPGSEQSPSGSEEQAAPSLFSSSRPPGPGQPPAPPPAPQPALTPVERRVYDLVGRDPVLQDVILRAAELPPGDVLAAVTSLQLKGLVRRLPGNLVVRGGLA